MKTLIFALIMVTSSLAFGERLEKRFMYGCVSKDGKAKTIMSGIADARAACSHYFFMQEMMEQTEALFKAKGVSESPLMLKENPEVLHLKKVNYQHTCYRDDGTSLKITSENADPAAACDHFEAKRGVDYLRLALSNYVKQNCSPEDDSAGTDLTCAKYEMRLADVLYRSVRKKSLKTRHFTNKPTFLHQCQSGDEEVLVDSVWASTDLACTMHDIFAEKGLTYSHQCEVQGATVWSIVKDSKIVCDRTQTARTMKP